MSTDSTANIWRQFRTRLLTYTPLSGATVGSRLGDRLYFVQAPDDAPWPHAIGRLTMRPQGDYGDRLAGELEIQLYDRPRAKAEALEDMADVCDQAMLRYADAASGLTFATDRLRDTLPANLPPADREVCAIRLVYSFVVWPVFLTRHNPTVL